MFESRSGEVYSIQHYAMKLVSDLQQVGGFLRVLRFLHNKTDRHDITEILLKVAKFAIQQDICNRNEHLIFCKFISILNVANFVSTLISGERYKLFGVYFGVPCNPLFKICFTKAIVAMIYKTVCLFMCNN